MLRSTPRREASLAAKEMASPLGHFSGVRRWRAVPTTLIVRSAIEPQDARLQVGLQLAAAELIKCNPLPPPPTLAFCCSPAKLN